MTKGTGLAAFMSGLVSGLTSLHVDATAIDMANEAGEYGAAKEIASRAMNDAMDLAATIGTDGVDCGFVETAPDCDTPIAAMDGGGDG